MTARTDAGSRTSSDEWGVAALDLDRYLDRIRCSARARPSAEALAAVHRAHVETIPFENFDIVLDRGVSLDLEDIQSKVVTHRRGGYCFEHNLLLAAALERLGYCVERLLARVHEDSGSVAPRTHLMLRVTVDGATWLADAGFGIGLIEPVPWGGVVHRQGGWAYVLSTRHDGHELRERASDGWGPLYGVDLVTQRPRDIEVANHFTSTHPSSPFVGRAVAMRRRDGTRTRLTNRRLQVARADGSVTHRRLADEDFPQVLLDEFSIELDAGELRRLLSTLPLDLPHH